MLSVLQLLELLLIFSFEVSSQRIESNCLREVKFMVVLSRLSFDGAKHDCEERGATLARISNTDEHSFVQDLFDDTRLDTSDVWIGRLV